VRSNSTYLSCCSSYLLPASALVQSLAGSCVSNIVVVPSTPTPAPWNCAPEFGSHIKQTAAPDRRVSADTPHAITGDSTGRVTGDDPNHIPSHLRCRPRTSEPRLFLDQRAFYNESNLQQLINVSTSLSKFTASNSPSDFRVVVPVHATRIYRSRVAYQSHSLCTRGSLFPVTIIAKENQWLI
jgi:hypothetical protein